MLPLIIKEVSDSISKFPGVGKKSSLKLALDILNLVDEDYQGLIQNIEKMRKNVNFCTECGFFAEDLCCEICKNQHRHKNQICIVEKPTDIITMEKSNIYTGKYHVLKNLISPLDNIFADDTTVHELVDRVEKIDQKEIELILFLRAGFSTDATVAYLRELLNSKGLIQKVKITRLAQGLPLYYNPETLDQATMVKALEDRTKILL